MSKELTVITLKVDVNDWEEQERRTIKGSIIDVCCICQESVWLSPESHRLVYEDCPDDSEIVCYDCHEKNYWNDDK